MKCCWRGLGDCKVAIAHIVTSLARRSGKTELGISLDISQLRH